METILLMTKFEESYAKTKYDKKYVVGTENEKDAEVVNDRVQDEGVVKEISPIEEARKEAIQECIVCERN